MSTIAQACSSGVEYRPTGPMAASTSSLPTASWKNGIIAVVVGPGLVQLSRIPWSRISPTDRQAVQALMTCLEVA